MERTRRGGSTRSVLVAAAAAACLLDGCTRGMRLRGNVPIASTCARDCYLAAPAVFHDQ